MRRGEARKARLKALSPFRTRIDSFAHDGRGVAHVDGKAVFIEGALPGEEVDFRYTALRRGYAEGLAERIVSPAPDRVEPGCSRFAVCGGCRLQHLASASQIAAKQGLLLEQLRRIGRVEPEAMLPPLTGKAWGYRRRARLGVKHVAKKGKVLVGFREKASSLIAEIETCPVLHPSVGERIPEISRLIEQLSIRDRLPQIEVAAAENTTALVFRALADPSVPDLSRLRAFGAEHGFSIYLQRHGPESVQQLHPERLAKLTYSLPAQQLHFQFGPGDFTQVNLDVNRRMVGRVVELLELAPEQEVLDLFCGLGNFTLPIAQRVKRVIGVEGESALVEKARHNAAANDLANAEFHIADLFQARDGVPWLDRGFDRVLLDPSRAGAQEVLRYAAHWQSPRIVYVSCNPSTLARDAGILVHQHGYRLLCAGVMDMFPHTAHVESLAVFVK